MCELLGLNANVPTDICFSFSGLMERGGRTGPHKDGWGIAFYEGKGCRTFHDPLASADSEVAKLVKGYPIKSLNVVCHIRQATHGRVCLENTHPFTRELWGRNWAFAHNGKLKGVKRWPLKYYKPIGTTDSEYAFCWVLDQLRQKYPKPPAKPETLWRTIKKLFAKVDEQGVFNGLLSDSKYLYAYCSTHLAWVTRRAPFGEASLIDTEMTVDFAKETTPNDVVTMVATRPLTDNEEWTVLTPGDFLVFHEGISVFN
ncbi:MAG: class II glutamine amidotransferase [Rhodospirillales bacterium]|nr:class II glutamine amidotransferase [Rhodospirillales bacterium]